MKACVDTFATGLNDLVIFLANADRETELVKSLLGEARQSSLTSGEKSLLAEITKAGTGKKQYVYAVGIIGLYGLLERFVDSILERYVAIISSLVSHYDELPDLVQRNHVLLSVELVKAVTEERHRGDLTIPEIISNLHSCLSGSDAFRVNGPAFVLHRGNIKLGKVRDFISGLGIPINLRRIAVMPTFESFFAAVDPPRDARIVQDADLDLMLAPIDELVEKRNLVAHGVIDDIESIDLLMVRCRFIAAFVGALHELLQQEVLRIEISRGDAQDLGRPIQVFDGRIVCFESAKCDIAVGDRLVAETGDLLVPFRWSPTINLEVDHVRHQELRITTRTQFGVEVGFKALKNHNYFVLRRKVEAESPPSRPT